MNKLQNWLSERVKNFAVRQWEQYAIKKEWLSVILLLLLTKMATSVVSVFSGYQYLNNFFFALVNNESAAFWFALISLALIEGLAALFLAKFFKFLLSMKWLTAIMPLFFAILVFAVSFVTSTNGIAIYTSEGVDLSQEINAKFNSLIENRKLDYAADVDNIKDHITAIKNNPEEWRNGQRCVLSKAQNEDLTRCYDKLNALKVELTNDVRDIQEQQKIELADNATHTTNEADKYYNIVAWIMTIQVVCSGALWFFWAKICGEDAPDVDAKQDVKEIYNYAEKLIKEGVNTCISTQFGAITTAFQTLDNELHRRNLELTQRHQDLQKEEEDLQLAASTTTTPADNTHLTESTQAAVEGPKITSTQHQTFRIKGFGVDSDTQPTIPNTAPENGQNTATPEQQHSATHGPVVSPRETGKNSQVIQTRICPYCGREFMPRAWNQRFCNINGDNACKNAFWAQQGVDLGKIKKANAKK